MKTIKLLEDAAKQARDALKKALDEKFPEGSLVYFAWKHGQTELSYGVVLGVDMSLGHMRIRHIGTKREKVVRIHWRHIVRQVECIYADKCEEEAPTAMGAFCYHAGDHAECDECKGKCRDKENNKCIPLKSAVHNLAPVKPEGGEG